MYYDSDMVQKEERNIFLRILFGFLWFIPFFFLTNVLVEIVVAAAAGFKAVSFEAGAAAGGPAAEEFFQKYGLVIFFSQVLAYAALCLLKWVPGVGKYRKAKRTQ